jgi:hypothetical protein
VSQADGSAALDGLYWRAEILQALYWMRGEGLAEAVAPRALAEFLVAAPDIIERECASLAAEGFLMLASVDGPRYGLTPLGVAEGGRSFHDDFADFIKPAHAECGPGCWCRDPKHAGEPCPSTPAPVPSPGPSLPEQPHDG